jgi:hypothetical protein
MLKTRYMYEQVARKASANLPKSIRLMFFKALFSIERLKNKYLTLTTITNINLYTQKNLGYF